MHCQIWSFNMVWTSKEYTNMMYWVHNTPSKIYLTKLISWNWYHVFLYRGSVVSLVSSTCPCIIVRFHSYNIHEPLFNHAGNQKFTCIFSLKVEKRSFSSQLSFNGIKFLLAWEQELLWEHMQTHTSIVCQLLQRFLHTKFAHSHMPQAF